MTTHTPEAVKAAVADFDAHIKSLHGGELNPYFYVIRDAAAVYGEIVGRVPKIDLKVLEKEMKAALSALHICIDAAVAEDVQQKVLRYIGALTAAQPQPQLTDARRKAALDARGETLQVQVMHGKGWLQVGIDSQAVDHVLTITKALSAPSVQEVTVEEFADKMVRDLRPDKDAQWMLDAYARGIATRHANAIMEKYPQGLRIVRGEGEKS